MNQKLGKTIRIIKDSAVSEPISPANNCKSWRLFSPEIDIQIWAYVRRLLCGPILLNPESGWVHTYLKLLKYLGWLQRECPFSTHSLVSNTHIDFWWKELTTFSIVGWWNGFVDCTVSYYSYCSFRLLIHLIDCLEQQDCDWVALNQGLEKTYTEKYLLLGSCYGLF